MAAAALLACAIAIVAPAGAEQAPPAISVNDVTQAEGTTFTFKITIPDVAANDVSVKATTSGGSGYTPRTNVTVTIPAGQKSTDFEVTTAGNDLDEADRLFTVTLSDPAGADAPTIADGTGAGTITDDDATPTLAISGPQPTTEGAVTVGYSVTMIGRSASKVTVDYATANGTATAGANQDYAAKSGSLEWAAAETGAKSFEVQLREDALDENDETFTVTISNANNATISTPTATTTITDDDDPPIVKIAKAPDVTEGGMARFPITLDRASGRTVNVTYRTANGTAQSGSDFNGTSNATVQIAAGGLTGEIAVQTIETLNAAGQKIAEPDETFSVALIVNPTLRLAPPDDEATAKIVDDEVAANPTVSSPSIPEGDPATPDNPGTTALVFKVSLQGPHPAMTFNYRTTAGTANGSDYVEVGGNQVSLPANTGSGVTEQNITIGVKRDLVDENDEQFKLELFKTDATEAKVAEGTGTIRNDDNNSSLKIDDPSAGEPGTLAFTVTLTQASERQVTVNWATADGTATAAADYTAGSGVLTFAPGDTSETIQVAVLGDAIDEPNETVLVSLSNPVKVNLPDEQGLGTIEDKNAPPSLSISDTTAREGEGATFTVTLVGTTLQTVAVHFNTVDGTAKAGSDYVARNGSLSFAPGEKSKTIVVTVLDDTAAEPVEEFSVTIGDAPNAAITKSRGDASIEASDRSLDPVATPQNEPKTPTAPKAQLVPRMILGPRTVTVGVNGLARMQVNCQRISPIVCAGTVELERAAKPLLKLGKKTFSVKKGTKAYASIKLTPRALKALRKGKTMRVKVIVLVKTSTKTMKVSPGIITLKATPALLKAKLKPTAPPPPQVVVDP